MNIVIETYDYDSDEPVSIKYTIEGNIIIDADEFDIDCYMNYFHFREKIKDRLENA